MSIADQIAGAINARKAGSWWRTSTAFCHGGDTEGGLAFLTPNDDPEKLIVHCHTHGCHKTPEGRNHARDTLRAAAGLPPWQPSDVHDSCKQRKGSGGIPYKRTDGAGRPVTAPEALQKHIQTPTGADKSAESRSERKSANNRGGDTADYATQLWRVARPFAEKAPADHPVGLWLRDRGVWPADQPLPASVRWLPREQLPRGKAVKPASTAVGTLVLAMRPLSDPAGAVCKVQLVAIDQAGGKAQHWDHGDKCSYGADPARVGLLSHWPLENLAGHDLHIAEGLADGLAILAGLPILGDGRGGGGAFRYARAGSLIVAVLAGKSYAGVDPAPFDSVTIWPDADDPDALPTAREQAQRWAAQGYGVAIGKLPAGYDPAGYMNEWRLRQNG